MDCCASPERTGAGDPETDGSVVGEEPKSDTAPRSGAVDFRTGNGSSQHGAPLGMFWRVGLGPGALAAGAAGASFASAPLGWRLAAAAQVVVVEQRVRQLVELARLVVGETLGLTRAGVGEEGHAAGTEPGA